MHIIKLKIFGWAIIQEFLFCYLKCTPLELSMQQVVPNSRFPRF